MSCDEVRERLAEHLLGTLDEPIDAEVRRHLRGCAACRAELVSLEEGVSTFARAAHQIDPPDELEGRVLQVLQEEWDTSEPDAHRSRRPWLAWAAAVIVLAGSLTWGSVSTMRANRFQASATRYEEFLGILGGENVRVGKLEPVGPQSIEGSAVLYDSKVEQSWVLILARAPGMDDTASVTLSTPDGHAIRMHPLEFGGGGEASSWLVTSSDLRAFDTVTIRDARGRIVAQGTVTQD